MLIESRQCFTRVRLRGLQIRQKFLHVGFKFLSEALGDYESWISPVEYVLVGIIGFPAKLLFGKEKPNLKINHEENVSINCL